ncbi:hypothetical protein HMPREF1624_06029 [Sporothrix schenckii ATCC 58251]|uniref:MARVEL domain-containing protein n=1 Tax=Sporothrix schenckii (strain ATCC 58251 / de Perez 2211183) TaxID=1391915 RepID=U7PQE0_SPOS1|nr:hypothetical protein HMPREF1624_06029 [Sporothrix schenckii ATCC 58251]
MLFAIFFAFWRFAQILTLIPIMGMLSWFIHAYINENELTPNYILVLFIVSVLGVVWTIVTLFSYHRSSSNSHFVSLVDLAFVGALIGAVYQLRFITDANCYHVESTDAWLKHARSLLTLTSQGINVLGSNTPCAVLKTSFALGIMNIVFFFFTAVLAWMHGGKMSRKEHDRRVVTETTTVRRHRSRGGSRPRSGSGHSRRSSHSHQRMYV